MLSPLSALLFEFQGDDVGDILPAGRVDNTGDAMAAGYIVGVIALGVLVELELALSFHRGGFSGL